MASDTIKGLGIVLVIGWVFAHWTPGVAKSSAAPNAALAAASTPDAIARAYFVKQGAEPIGRLRGGTAEIVWNIDPYGGSKWLTKYSFAEQARDLIPLVLARLPSVTIVEMRAYGDLVTVKGQVVRSVLVQMKMTRQESATINWPGVDAGNVPRLTPDYHENPALRED